MKAMTARRRKNIPRLPSRRQPKEQRREAILAAAFEVFAAHGFEAARIDEVARRAGIAKGTIYLYFRDKERLFQAVVRNLIPRRFDVLVRSLPGSPAEVLRAVLSQMYTNVVRNERVRAIVRMLVAESGRFPQLAEIYFQEIIVPGMRAMRQVLTKGMSTSEFHKARVSEFPQIVVAPGLLAMVWQLLFAKNHPLDLETYMQAHMDFVMRSLEPRRE